ncbi:hypothetical protein AAFF_G00108370 [Aldrovandia affinis]|uniref:Chemokine interleukin-8-like domain-containing protein n=1 Tax=Aldrovandia affinis TaxID=143900 RepID=A0AAD7WB70_9TELE|nr:hypothetical protein AAFF_G00108370 [Aldrovandia affinis]
MSSNQMLLLFVLGSALSTCVLSQNGETFSYGQYCLKNQADTGSESQPEKKHFIHQLLTSLSLMIEPLITQPPTSQSHATSPTATADAKDGEMFSYGQSDQADTGSGSGPEKKPFTHQVPTSQPPTNQSHATPPIAKAYKIDGKPGQCCFKFVSRVPRHLIVDYMLTAAECPMPGIVMSLKNGRFICVDPRKIWVQRFMKELDEEKLAVQPFLGRP